MANIYGHPDGNLLDPPADDCSAFSPLPEPLTPALEAVRAEANADFDRQMVRADRAAFHEFCGRNGIDPDADEIGERAINIWCWSFAIGMNLHAPQGGNE